jgi:hypothetical protein
MSAQITQSGFNEIITKIKEEWVWLELRELNSSNVDVPLSNVRFNLSSDLQIQVFPSRYSFELDLTNNKYEVVIRLNGLDADLKDGATRKKISGAKLYSEQLSGTAKAEVVYATPIQFTNDDDELIIRMTIKK